MSAVSSAVADEVYRREQDTRLNKALSGELAAFIQSAMHSLRDNRTGVPKEWTQ